VSVLRVFIQNVGIAPYDHVFLNVMLRDDNVGIKGMASLRVVGRSLDVIADVVHHENTLKNRRLPILMNVDSRPASMLPLIKSCTGSFDICLAQKDFVLRSIYYFLSAYCAICRQVLNRGTFS
jgi:hypothetical protein